MVSTHFHIAISGSIREYIATLPRFTAGWEIVMHGDIMNKPPETNKTNQTRKRLYAMSHEDALEIEALPEPAENETAAVSLPAIDVARSAEPYGERAKTESAIWQMGAPLQDNAPATKVSQREDRSNAYAPVTGQPQNRGAAAEPQQPPVMSEPSAMAIAALEFSTENAASGNATASAQTSEKPQVSVRNEPFQSAMTTVRAYSALSAATGLIPLPLVDMAGLMTMQLLMLKKLCEQYDIPFNSQRSKSAVAILLSGINCRYMAVSSAKLIPFFGAFTMAAMPVMNGAISYAVGRVFIKHFSSGGTFLDFDPTKARGYFEEQYCDWKLNRPGMKQKI